MQTLASNVSVKKSYLKYVYKILCCFVMKVSNVTILLFLVAFFLHILEVYVTLKQFLALFGSFGPYTLFFSQTTFSGKIISAQTFLLQKSCLFAFLVTPDM